MSRRKITSHDFPIREGESWWIIHPNNGNVEFKAPIGAVTVCTSSFEGFRINTVYEITDNDELSGNITLANKEDIVEMPYYIFARYFDAEAFVRPIQSPINKNINILESIKFKG